MGAKRLRTVRTAEIPGAHLADGGWRSYSIVSRIICECCLFVLNIFGDIPVLPTVYTASKRQTAGQEPRSKATPIYLFPDPLPTELLLKLKAVLRQKDWPRLEWEQLSPLLLPSWNGRGGPGRTVTFALRYSRRPMRSCTGYRWPSSLTPPPSPASGWMWWTGACCFSRMSAEGKTELLDNGMLYWMHATQLSRV